MSRIHRTRVITATGLLALAAIVASPSPASAEICGSQVNSHLGYIHAAPQSVIGTMAGITVRDNDLCSGATNQFLTGWVMLQELGVPHGYAQVGHIRFLGDSTPSHFAEFDSDYDGSPGTGDWSRVVSSGVTVGSTVSYWVYYNSAAGRLDLNYGFTQVTHTTFNPFNEWSGVGSFWAGETTHTSSDIMGSSGQQESFGNLQVQPFNSSSYIQNPYALNTFNTGDSSWNLSVIAWNSFNEWDDD